MKKKIIYLVLMLCILATLLAALPLTVGAATSNMCGDNLTYTIKNGVLTINGNGDMYNYGSWGSSNASPWNGNTNIKSIVINEGVTSIGSYAFSNCVYVTNIQLPEGIKEIGEFAFQNCWRMLNINIPSSVSNIGNRAFAACDSIVLIDVDDNNLNYSSIDGCLFSKDQTQFIRYTSGKETSAYSLPNCTQVICDGAFYCSYNLTNIIIPHGVTTIEAGAFAGCTNLINISIPYSVTEIDSAAFEGCEDLVNVYFGGIKSQWDKISIKSQNSYLKNATKHYGYYTPEEYEYIIPEEKTGTFTYESGAGYAGFTYNDEYFCNSSYYYNHNTARISMRLALSAFATKNIDTQYENAEKLLNAMGFQGINHNDWYTKKTEKNSIGVIAGRKHIAFEDDNYTIIAVAIRGRGYKSEWGGNFNVGDGELHAGFREARDQVIAFIKEYMISQRIGGNIKLWITGYSRAAATANLTAAYFDENPADVGTQLTLTPENIYAYCFETPAGTCASNRNDKLYNNIFSILNRHDPVPMVVMNRWNYGRYGITKYLPSAQTAKNYSKMSTTMKLHYEDYANKSHYDYVIDDFASYELYVKTGYDWLLDYSIGIRKTEINQYPENQGLFLDNVIINNLSIMAESPQVYAQKYQSDLVSIGEKIVGEDNAKALGQDILEAIQKKKGLYITGGIFSVGNPVVAFGTGISAYYKMREIVKDSLKKYDASLSDDTLDMVVNFLLSLSPNQLCTLLMNLEGLGQAHEPEICLAWMDTIDGSLLTSPHMRSFHINCPVDVEIYDSENTLVATIYNNIPQKIEGSFISTYIDENGQKIVYLPTDEEYRIEVVATDDGEVTYSIHEQNSDTGETKIINYNNMTVKKEDTLTGIVENLTVNEVASYALTSSTVKISEAEIIEEADPIIIETSAIGNGVTSSGREYYKGEYAQVIATPVENEEFLGWYEGDSLVSTDSTYRFQVVNDVTLTAKFTENTCEIIFLDDEDYVISTQRVVKGDTVTIPDVPQKDGYRFVGFYKDKEYITAIATDDVYTENTALYAKYEAPSTYNGFQYYINGDTIEIVGYQYSSYELRVPISINGLMVTKIADESFISSQFETILIPDTVTTIGAKAFDGCEYLKTVNYIGAEEQWDAINIGENNDVLNNVEKVFEYSENIVYGGFYNIGFTGTSIETTLGFDYVYRDCVAVVEIRDNYNELEKTVEIDISKGTENKDVSIPFDADDERHYISVSFVNNTTDKTIIGNGNRRYFYAEKVRYTDGDYTYTVIGNNAEILGYNGEDTDVTIPTSLGGYSVTRIWNYAFRNSEITSIEIPSSITFIGDYVFDSCYNLSNIIVEENNVNYCSMDGNLYSKDKTQLIKYAIGKTATEWTIPNSVTTIKSGALSNSEYLENITIPDGVKVIEDYAFAYGMWETIEIPASVTDIASSAFAFCSNLKAINIDDGNINYSSENGVFLNKDKTILIQYPTAKTDSSYKIPTSVETVSAESFVGSIIQTIYIPKSLKNVGRYAFENCEYLNTVFYEGTQEEYWNINFTGNYVLQYADITFGYDGMPASIKSVKCWYDNNKVTAKIKFNYLEQAGTLYLAIYDEGRLVDIKDKPVAIDEMENTIEIIDTDENYKDYDVKVLYWDGNSSLKPLAKFVEAEIVEAVLVDDVLESEHPYANGTDETKTFVYDGECISIDVTFSDDTITESGWDYIYIYDANGNQIGKYSGTELAGQTIPVRGNTVKIRLTSDGSVNKNGYRTESIVVNK